MLQTSIFGIKNKVLRLLFQKRQKGPNLKVSFQYFQFSTQGYKVSQYNNYEHTTI